MTLWKCLLVGLALMALTAVQEGVAVLVPFAAVWLGALLGVRLRPSVGTIVSERRLPKGDECAAVGLGMVGSVLTFSAMGIVAARGLLALDGHGMDWKDAVGSVFWLICTAVPIIPMWTRILRGPEAGPLRPIAAALLAAPIMGLGLGILWLAWVEGLTKPYAGSEDALGAVLATPLCALLIGFAGSAILWATRNDTAVRPVFRATMTVALAAWGTVILVLVVALSDIGGAGALVARSGAIWAAVSGVLIALAWCVGLWRARTLAVDGTVPIVLSIAVLAIAFPISLWTISTLMESDSTWAPLAALLGFPFTLATAGLCAFVVPSILRLLSGLGGGRLDPPPPVVPWRQA